MVPICVRVFQAAGINPIPYIYVIIAASHCGFMLPSSAGSSAVAAGYGINLRTMFVAGFGAACVCLAVIVAISVLSIYYWPGFAAA
jgi:di/tricarboxylate transporter